jgi:FlaA1/EpsC-like NDP-sugar epimerase
MNVIDAAIDRNVSRVVALSTDKASSPVNLYGATKLASDKLFTAANAYSGADGCLFSVVRYGNVAGSRGSIIPFFLSLPNSKATPITHPEMTRFILNLDDAVELVVKAVEDMKGSELYVKKIPSVNIVDLAKWLRPHSEIDIIGIRPGEKLHEQMISSEESNSTYEYDGYYKVLPQTDSEFIRARSVGGNLVPANFKYVSNINDHWLTEQQFVNMLGNMRGEFLD